MSPRGSTWRLHRNAKRQCGRLEYHDHPAEAGPGALAYGQWLLGVQTSEMSLAPALRRASLLKSSRSIRWYSRLPFWSFKFLNLADSMELEQKLKTALDESRLLILGAQVLFAFQFQAVFQDSFQSVSWDGKVAQCGGLMLLLVAVGLLIAPSLLHQLAYRGESRRGMLDAATGFAGTSLLPLTLGLGASVFTIFEHLFGGVAGYITGSAFTILSLSLLYGLGLALRTGDARMPEERETPLRIKIEQLLTEARVIIPGGQALLGFQLVATLTRSFSELPDSAKYIHAFAICAVLSAITLLMTPAALHRIAFHGEDDETFFHIGSALVITATWPLAIGISADVYVVFFEVSKSMWIAALAALLSFSILLGLWFIYPIWHRSAARPRLRGSHG
jgi:Family of unknown function (DUF6328)